MSIASVSLVLNDPDTPRVSAAKRRQILKTASHLGYQPNLLAQGLLRRGTRIVGLSVPMRDPFFFNLFIAEVLGGIQTCLREHGYYLIVDTHSAARGKMTRSQIMQSKGLDGVLFINTRLCSRADMNGTIRNLRSEQIPFVMLTSYYGDDEINYVGVDDGEIGRVAGHYLCAKGHRRIALLGGSRTSPASVPLARGFREGLSCSSVSLAPECVIYGEYERERVRGALLRWLRSKRSPTAIFCASDQMVPDVYELLRERRVRIPEDVAILGRGDLMFAPFLYPPLTTIRVPAAEIGHRGAELLVNALHKPSLSPRRVYLPCRLVERGSV